MQAASGLIYLRKGELGSALIFFQKANTLARDADIQSMFSFVSSSLGYTYLLSRRPDQAFPILEEAVKPQNLNFSIVPAIYCFTALTEAYRLNGKNREAIEAAEKALSIFRQTKERCFGAWALYTMAKIQSENDSEQIEQATHTFSQTKELADGLKMRPLLAHCCRGLGKIYTRSGETEKCCAGVAAIIKF